MRIRGIDPGTASYGVVDLDDDGRLLLALSGRGPSTLLHLPRADVWAVEAVESYGRIRAAQIVALAEAAGAAVHQCRIEGGTLAGRPRRRDVLAALGVDTLLPAAVADVHIGRQVALRVTGWDGGGTHVVDAAAVALWAARELSRNVIRCAG